MPGAAEADRIADIMRRFPRRAGARPGVPPDEVVAAAAEGVPSEARIIAVTEEVVGADASPGASHGVTLMEAHVTGKGAQDHLRRLADSLYKTGETHQADIVRRWAQNIAVFANPLSAARRSPGDFEAFAHVIFEGAQDAWLNRRLGRFVSRGQNPWGASWFRAPVLGDIGYGSRINAKGYIKLRASATHPSVAEGKRVNVLFGDMMEAPSRFKLTEVEQAWVDDAHSLIRRLTDELLEELTPAQRADFKGKMIAAQKLRDEAGLEYYWPRFAESPKTDRLRIVNHKLDDIPSIMKDRVMHTMEQGAERGVKYEADPMAVLTHWTRAVMKEKRNAITIRRLVDQKLLVTEKTEGYSASNLFNNYSRIFLRDDVPGPLEDVLGASLDQVLATDANGLIRGLKRFFGLAKAATSVAKTGQTGLTDIGTALTHSFVVPWISRTREPLTAGVLGGRVAGETTSVGQKIWGQAGLLKAGGQMGGPKIFVESVAMSVLTYLGELGPSGTRGIFEAWMSMSKLVEQAQRLGGMNFTPALEYFGGVGILKKIPVAGPVFGRVGAAASAAFNMGVGYGRANLFDSFLQMQKIKIRDGLIKKTPSLADWVKNPQSARKLEELIEVEMTTPEMRQEFLRIGRRVDGLLGVSNTRTLGISRTQQDIENVFFLFSQTYTRSLLGQLNVLAGSGAMPKETAWILARSLAGYATIFYTARFFIEKSKGLSNTEALKRAARSVNPRSGREFLGIPIGGGWYGIGGLYRSVLATIGGFASMEAYDWDSGIGALIANNPAVRAWRGRHPPLTSFVTDAMDHNTFIGEPFDIKDFFDSEKALEVWLDRVGPFNMEALLESINDDATPWGIFGAFTLESAGGRYVRLKVSDLERQALDNYISAEPNDAQKMGLHYLTDPGGVTQFEWNKILVHPDNVELGPLIEKTREEQKGWYGERGELWAGVRELREQRDEELRLLEKEANAAAKLGKATEDPQERGHKYRPERYYAERYEDILSRYYVRLDDYMKEAREQGWLDKKGDKTILDFFGITDPDKGIRPEKEAERDYFLLMDGDLNDDNELLSDTYDRIVKPYYRETYGEEGQYSPLQEGAALNMDFNEYHLRFAALKAHYGSDLLATIRTAYRVKLPKMERERREAADYIREHYHNLKISPEILREFFGENEEHKRLYVQYVRSSSSRKQAMLNAAEGDPTSVVNVFPQLDASNSASKKRLSARRSDTHLENLLVTWGNVDKTILEHGLRQVPSKPSY
jgi:hypothetical protein